MENIVVISFIKRGKNRKRVFEALDKPMMPSEIVKKIFGKTSNTYFNVVSRALAELESQGLIKCLNPKEKTGRFYTLTKKGSDILKKL